MRRVSTLVRSLVGQKAVMAVSGIVLILFVIGHLLGNLKVFQGPEKFNAYAEGLRAFGEPFLPRGWALWGARFGLLAAPLGTGLRHARLGGLQERIGAEGRRVRRPLDARKRLDEPGWQ